MHFLTLLRMAGILAAESPIAGSVMIRGFGGDDAPGPSPVEPRKLRTKQALAWIETACRRSCTPRRRLPATAHKHCRQSPMCPAFLASAADRAVIRMSLSWIADTTARRLGAPCVHGASSRSSLVAERITEAASDGVNRFSIRRSIDSKEPSHSRPTRRSHSNQLVRMSSFQPSPVSVSDCGGVSLSNEPFGSPSSWQESTTPDRVVNGLEEGSSILRPMMFNA